MSQALPQLSSDLFWWVYNSEGGSRSAFSAQEYAPSTAAPFFPLWRGSVLPSASFSLNGRDTLPGRTVKVVPQTGEIDTAGFASLLQDSALAAVLFTGRPDSGIRRGDIPSPLTHFVPGTPPRLKLTSSNRLVWPDTHVVLGGNASGAGTDTWTTDLAAVMVVNSAAVPEPASESWLILAFGLGTVIARGRWLRLGVTHKGSSWRRVYDFVRWRTRADGCWLRGDARDTKGQIRWLPKEDVVGQVQFIQRILI